MAEIHIECPHCKTNIIAKFQAEVYDEQNSYQRDNVLQQIYSSLDTVIVRLKDGTERELTNFTELEALLGGQAKPQQPPIAPGEKVTPQSFTKIVVHYDDGTIREVTRFDELVLLFLELETQRKTIEAYSDERLEQEINRITEHIQRRKEHHPQQLRGWRGLARTLFLEKHRWLLMEEQERRTTK